MSKTLAKLVELNKGNGKRGSARQGKGQALEHMRQEAKDAGATLANDGEGGLDAALALKVMHRDKYTCKRCGGQENISLHHKGHLKNPVSRWLKKKGKSDDESGISTICARCHDAIHKEDEGREE